MSGDVVVSDGLEFMAWLEAGTSSDVLAKRFYELLQQPFLPSTWYRRDSSLEDALRFRFVPVREEIERALSPGELGQLLSIWSGPPEDEAWGATIAIFEGVRWLKVRGPDAGSASEWSRTRLLDVADSVVSIMKPRWLCATNSWARRFAPVRPHDVPTPGLLTYGLPLGGHVAGVEALSRNGRTYHLVVGSREEAAATLERLHAMFMARMDGC